MTSSIDDESKAGQMVEDQTTVVEEAGDASTDLAKQNLSRRVLDRLSLPYRALRENPVVLKEMRSQMRGKRAFIIITVYLVILSSIIGLIYVGFISAEETSPTASIRQGVGKAIFGAVVGLELMMVCFLSPALTAGSISAERERQTYDLLRTTLLPAKSLILGKLVSALAFLVILLFVGFPLQSLAFIFGGISTEEVFISLLMLLATAFFFSSIGMFISSFMRSILASTVISYIAAILVAFGTPIFIGITAAFLGITSQAMTSLTTYQETLVEIAILTVGYAFVIINPLATAIATEFMILQEQNAFFVSIPLSNGWNYPIIGPWMLYILVYGCIGALLLLISIRLVHRAEK